MNKQTEEKNVEVVETIRNNSELLFIYDATRCNPNGDPDDENKPRMDYDRNVNLVSDVRLKRYIRDYLMDYKNETVFVCKVDGETVDATGRLKYLYFLSNIILALDDKGKLDDAKLDNNVKKILKSDTQSKRGKLENFITAIKDGKKDFKDINSYKGLSKELNLKISGKSSDLQEIKDTDIAKLNDNCLLSELIDVRYFGATMPIKSKEGIGSSRTFTGPIQFNWGYSLNKVMGPMDSNGITATFGGATDEYSTMGKDYRVDYSIIAFHGIISAKRAEHTLLKDDDIDLFDEAMIKAIPLEATTRSKTGQNPLLYIRVEYNNPEFFLCDLRKYVKLLNKKTKELNFDETDKLRSTKDYEIDLTELKGKLEKKGSNISAIYFWRDEDVEINGWNLEEDLEYKEDGKVKVVKVIKLPKTQNK